MSWIVTWVETRCAFLDSTGEIADQKDAIRYVEEGRTSGDIVDWEITNVQYEED